MSSARPTVPGAAAPDDRAFFGHPRGLSTLFFTEMWERFSYYGMRALLILFMTAPAAAGGLGMNAATAGAIYGTYTSMVYMVSVPGGWIADRLLGQRRAVLYGGLLITCGHFSMAMPRVGMFYVGLVLIVLGTGLLKPSISVIVGQLYTPTDHRRDAGFSIFYMGINLGAFVAPLVTGFLAQDARFRAWLLSMGLQPEHAWHWGFGAAGIGMAFGVLQYVLGDRLLGDAGLHPATPESPKAFRRLQGRTVAAVLLVVALLAGFGLAESQGLLHIAPSTIASAGGYLLLLVAAGFFGWLYTASGWTTEERGRLYVIGIFFLAAAVFFSVFEQAGSTLNLFADRSTRNRFLGIGFPSSWYQSMNPLFIITLAPIFAWLWVRLDDREPSSPVKFSIGLIGVGAGFALLVPAAQASAGGALVSPMWLTATYLIHTFAELCLSPVGLSSMTKLAPARIASLIMGVWFFGASVGNYMGGQMASFYESMSLPSLFGVVGTFGIGAGLLMLAFARPMHRMMAGVD